MPVKVAGVVPMEDARGDEMDRAETVTLFNDMCILAPGTLVGPDIAWEPVDASTARARFTLLGHTITATLLFDTEGRLVNFESNDRSRLTPDGTSTTPRFSTPLRDYRDFGPLHLAGYGEARWRLPEGECTYGEFTMREVVVDVTAALWVSWPFTRDMQDARLDAVRGSVLLQTRCGAIEYQESGRGVPLLAVHGSEDCQEAAALQRVSSANGHCGSAR